MKHFLKMENIVTFFHIIRETGLHSPVNNIL